jgi:hypothetical protein
MLYIYIYIVNVPLKKIYFAPYSIVNIQFELEAVILENHLNYV